MATLNKRHVLKSILKSIASDQVFRKKYGIDKPRYYKMSLPRSYGGVYHVKLNIIVTNTRSKSPFTDIRHELQHAKSSYQTAIDNIKEEFKNLDKETIINLSSAGYLNNEHLKYHEYLNDPDEMKARLAKRGDRATRRAYQRLILKSLLFGNLIKSLE
jgi:hypothetical protein